MMLFFYVMLYNEKVSTLQTTRDAEGTWGGQERPQPDSRVQVLVHKKEFKCETERDSKAQYIY